MLREGCTPKGEGGGEGEGVSRRLTTAAHGIRLVLRLDESSVTSIQCATEILLLKPAVSTLNAAASQIGTSSVCCAGELLPGQAQHAKQQAPVPTEYCSTILAMMSWDHLDSDLCQHVITLINRALDSPDGPHKGSPKCLVLRQRLVNALLDRGLMRVITDLQDLVQESLFQVSHHFNPVQSISMI